MASVTGLNPIFNGGIATYIFDFNYDQEKFVGPKEGGTFRDRFFVGGCKIFAIVDNLLERKGSLNKRQENIKRVIRTKRKGL
jgi:hypothetical protein